MTSGELPAVIGPAMVQPTISTNLEIDATPTPGITSTVGDSVSNDAAIALTPALLPGDATTRIERFITTRFMAALPPLLSNRTANGFIFQPAAPSSTHGSSPPNSALPEVDLSLGLAATHALHEQTLHMATESLPQQSAVLSRDLSNRSISPALEVKVSNFQWCRCGDSQWPMYHTIVKTSSYTLATGNAVALSYGIGDFDRAKHIFGHSDGPVPKPVKLEFGGEWNIPMLVKALVDLSEVYGAIWFDQLSIPQETAQVAVALQNMRSIYFSFDVIILLPNAPCTCLEEAVESWSATHSHASDSNVDLDLTGIITECMNAFPVSSYHFRLWTKQEFAYSRNLSFYYCGPPGGQCTRGRDPIMPAVNSLSEWCRWKYHCVAEAQDPARVGDLCELYAWLAVQSHQIKGAYYLITAVNGFCLRNPQAENQYQIKYCTARLMLGKELRQGKSQSLGFQTVIFEYLDTPHVASNQRDFALAIFPTIYDYHFPIEWRSMTLPQLVEDGIEQYEKTSRRKVCTRLPVGLFDMTACSSGSVRCKPTLYLRTEKISFLGDVYRAMVTGSHGPLFPGDDTYALRFRGEGQSDPPCLSCLYTYSEALGAKSTSESLNFMGKIKRPHGSWNKSLLFPEEEKLDGWAVGLFAGRIPAPDDRWPSSAHERVIFANLLDRKWSWGLWPEINHEEVCFELACQFVGIDPSVAKESGLGLMVKIGDEPCIGLVSGLYYDRIKSLEQRRKTLASLTTESKGMSDAETNEMLEIDALSERFLTINTLPTDLLGYLDEWALETWRLNDDDEDGFDPARLGRPAGDQFLSVYRVVGTWCGGGSNIAADIVEDSGECDAVLV